MGAAFLGAVGFAGLIGCAPQRPRVDVLVYGSTVAAITAAIQARRMGATVTLLSPDAEIGGMTTSGLGWTDIKFSNAIGGLAREFFHRVYDYYERDSAWDYPDAKDTYEGVRAQPGQAILHGSRFMWNFEPHAASDILRKWLEEEDIEIVRGRLDRERGVSLDGKRITEIRAEDGSTYAAAMFIDSTYEGDLMAAAGVSYRVGREGRDEHGETYAGIRFNPGPFEGIDPYREDGRLLEHLHGTADVSEAGNPDERVQAYCFRLCMSRDPGNQIPLTKPEGYRADEFELLFRYLARNPDTLPFTTRTPLPNRKIDANNASQISFDFLGGNVTTKGVSWAEGSYADRDEIWKAHKRYQLAYLWAVSNEQRVPASVREVANTWCLAADEFRSTGGWPPQLYIREARRMRGMTTITEQYQIAADTLGEIESVGMGSYSMDSHGVRRVVLDGKIVSEGGYYRHLGGPWQIPYGALVPERGSVGNLLVTCAVSASHASYGSIRMEPTYMILGQSAAIAAVLAKDGAVQDLPYADLAAELTRAKQALAA